MVENRAGIFPPENAAFNDLHVMFVTRYHLRNQQEARELARRAVATAISLGPNGNPNQLHEAAAAGKFAADIIGKNGKSWREVISWPDDIKVPTAWKARGSGNEGKRHRKYRTEPYEKQMERARRQREAWEKRRVAR